MKKFIFALILGIISIMSYSQTKIINKNVEIVKPVLMFIDEEGKSYFPIDTYVHIKIDDFDEIGNLVQYWIESDNEKFNKHFIKDVIVANKKNDIDNYYLIMDDMFIYMWIAEANKELLDDLDEHDRLIAKGKWIVNFQTKER